nr:TMEM175 family protein [Sphingomonas changbaiensis]
MLPFKLRHGADETLAVDRLSFLTDGVYAIVLTILVLELKIPERLTDAQIYAAIAASAPKFAAFAIAFSAASIGWTFTFLLHSVIRRSNFLHLVLTLGSLMFASLIPFASAMMGNYPDSPWGYAPYCLDIAGLCLVYTLDLLFCGRTLTADTIDSKIILALWLSTAACMALAIFGAVFLAFWSPHATWWVIAIGTVVIWVDYYLLARWIAREMAKESPGESSHNIEIDSPNRRRRQGADGVKAN